MRLKGYLTENKYEYMDAEDIAEILKRDCKPIINFYKKTKKPIYRGLKNNDEYFLKKNVRTDRKPRVVSDALHKLLDDLFLKYWGFKARSNGLFCGSKYISGTWGSNCNNPYIVFPIGKFEYIYTLDPTQNFWKYVLSRYQDTTGFSENQIEEIKKDVIEMYNNKNLEKVVRSEQEFEVILKCKSYYATKDIDVFTLIQE